MHKEREKERERVHFCPEVFAGIHALKERVSREEKNGEKMAKRPRGCVRTHGDGCYKLVGLASGSVYRKQMGYACSTPYFTGIYCLLFRRLGMI